MTKTCPTCGGTGSVEEARVAGKRLRRLRREFDLDLRQVAARAGVSIPELSSMEIGKKAVTPEMAERCEAAIATAAAHHSKALGCLPGCPADAINHGVHLSRCFVQRLDQARSTVDAILLVGDGAA